MARVYDLRPGDTFWVNTKHFKNYKNKDIFQIIKKSRISFVWYKPNTWFKKYYLVLYKGE